MGYGAPSHPFLGSGRDQPGCDRCILVAALADAIPLTFIAIELLGDLAVPPVPRARYAWNAPEGRRPHTEIRVPNPHERSFASSTPCQRDDETKGGGTASCRAACSASASVKSAPVLA
jgi:hypothetical protein